jgi:flagellar L-ring protein precursor FlgH
MSNALMNENRLTLFLLAFLVAANSYAAKNKKANQQQDNAAARLAQYIQRVKASTTPNPTPGSLWIPQGRLSDPAGDDKARNVNDTIIINVVEQTTAASDASVKSQRSFSATSSISALAGVVKPNNALQNLFSPQSSHALNGQAQTASDSMLTTSLAAQVVTVLPNGYFVIEAVREMQVNNQRQTLRVRGVVRPSDVATDNTVLSSQISDLEVDLNGKGVLSDGVKPPNKIVNSLLKLVEF